MLDTKTENQTTGNQLQVTPSESLQPRDRNDVTNLDEDHLQRYILSAFNNMIADKQDHGWLDKKNYARRAYYGLKNEAMKHWPWEGASAFPIPMTPTLVDTAVANIHSGIFADPKGPIRIKGIQDEDLRPGKILERYMNWQTMYDMDMETEYYKNALRTFIDGTGVIKTMFDIRTRKVRVVSLELENFYVPIDATGLQRDGTDIAVQIIPLSYNDVQLRKAMGVYRDPDAIIPGIGVVLKDSDQIRLTIDDASGVSKDTKARRDNYYIAEVHLTYIPPNSMRPLDLIVWINPNGGVIQRIRRVEDNKLRPFSASHAYMYDDDRFYSMGLPEKVRPEQEKLDYSDKQYTDGLDRANNPAAFVDDTEAFDRTRQQRVPGGIYPKGKGNTIDWEPQPPAQRGFSDERALIWEMAERKTGIIDITQGRASAFGGKTLGELEIRASRADVRFSAIFKRFETQHKDICRQIYELDDEYMPKDRIMDVIGFSAEGYTLNEIFPKKNGELVNFNFGFSGALLADRQAEAERKSRFYELQLADPDVDRGSRWRIKQELAETQGIQGFGSIVPKPKEANIVSAQEFVRRVVSGQQDLQIRPGIDADDYIFEIQLFERTQTYQNLEDYQRQMLSDALRRAYVMSVAERQAQTDLMLVQEKAKFGAIKDQMAAGLPQGSAPQVQPVQ